MYKNKHNYLDSTWVFTHSDCIFSSLSGVSQTVQTDGDLRVTSVVVSGAFTVFFTAARNTFNIGKSNLLTPQVLYCKHAEREELNFDRWLMLTHNSGLLTSSVFFRMVSPPEFHFPLFFFCFPKRNQCYHGDTHLELSLSAHRILTHLT